MCQKDPIFIEILIYNILAEGPGVSRGKKKKNPINVNISESIEPNYFRHLT